MNVLILTENTGGGHNSCAAAVKQYLYSQSLENNCIISSSLVFSSPTLIDTLCSLQIMSYRYIPGVMKLVFSAYGQSTFSEHSIPYSALTAGSERLYRFIQVNDIDTVICMHVFAAMNISKILNDHPDAKFNSAFLATDCKNDLSGTEINLTRYFIPDASISPEFEKMGIPKERIVASGIPVRAGFYSKVSKEEAKKALGIDPKYKHILVMSGSMGAGAISDIVLKLTTESLPENCDVTVICGSNKTMFETVSEMCKFNENFHIVGFTDKIPLYMDSADLYVTKPGGISTAEAEVKNLPMVLINTVGGCETGNLDFYCGLGLAKTAKNTIEIANLIASLIKDRKTLKEMEASSFQRTKALNASKTIIDTMKNLQTGCEN